MTSFFHQIDSSVQKVIREATQKIILPAFYEQNFDGQISVKHDQSVVTKTDVETQEFLQKKLRNILSESDFLGEEESQWVIPENISSEWLWILDPIDGTHNFAYQNNGFGTMLALWHVPTHRPVYGWIYMSVADLMFSGGAEEGAFCNGQRLPSSQAKKLLQDMTGLLNYNSFGESKQKILDNSAAFCALAPASCAALKFAALLRGTADFAAFGRAKIWDLSAGFALLEAIGGHAANIDNETDLSLDSSNTDKAWYLASGNEKNWQPVRDQLFKDIA